MSGLELAVAGTWSGEPIPAAERLVFTLSAAGEALRVRVDAPFHDDPPPPGPAGPTDRLWEHEVAELFVVGEDVAGAPAYTELELSPHGHYLLLRLSGVRRVVEKLLPVRYRAAIKGGRWRGEALLGRAVLPPPPHRVNAFAVHGRGERRRYLAMTPVPGPAPDFHRLDFFEAIELP